MSNIGILELGGVDPLYERYSDPGSLSWEDASTDLYTFYDPSRMPESDVERQAAIVNWLAEESYETADADLGLSAKNGLEEVGYLSYLSGAFTVRSLAPVATREDQDTYLRADALDYVADELTISRDALVKRLLGRAFKIVNELGDFNWFVNAQAVQHNIDPLEAVKACELASPSVRSWIGKLAASELSLPEFSDLLTTVALSSRFPRAQGAVALDRVPAGGREIVEAKILDLQNALESQSPTTDLTVDLVGCSLVYEHSILERCLNTPYSEMVFLNLMKLLERHRQKTTFAHEPDSLETVDLLSHWQPWLPKHDRELPRAT